jgi:hypothetical protein
LHDSACIDRISLGHIRLSARLEAPEGIIAGLERAFAIMRRTACGLQAI